MVNGTEMKATPPVCISAEIQPHPCSDKVTSIPTDVSRRFHFGQFMPFEAGFIIPVDALALFICEGGADIKYWMAGQRP